MSRPFPSVHLLRIGTSSCSTSRSVLVIFTARQISRPKGKYVMGIIKMKVTPSVQSLFTDLILNVLDTILRHVK